MELTAIYDTYLAQTTSAVVMTLQQEHNLNILGSKLELQTFPTYLDEDGQDWEGYSCVIDDGRLDVAFYFIVDVVTKELLELEILALSTLDVA